MKFEKIKLHNYLVKEIIIEVLDNFEILKKYNVCVFLTGSFARMTNKINSDLDLHFCYKNKYRDKLIKYEEIIYYILFSVFNLNRGKVHNMILSKINQNNNKFLLNKLDSKRLKIIFRSDSKKIEYTINGNIKSRIYLQYGNRKDLKYTFKYLKKEIKLMNREWAHVFYVFTNKKKFMKYYNQLYIYEKKKINNYDIIRRKERIKDYIDSINNMLKTINKNSMSDFKKIFQMEEFKILYEYISYKRDMFLINGDDWQFINLLDNQNILKEDSIYSYLMDYFYSLNDVTEPFKTRYSIHEDSYIEEYFFVLLEKKLKDLNEKIGEIL